MPDSNAFTLSRRDLLEIEGSTARSVEILQGVISERGITEANRVLAREALAKAESNLIKVRRLLSIPVVGEPPDVRRDLSVERGYAPADRPPHDARREDS